MPTYSIFRFTRFAALLGLVFSILSVITKASYSFSAFLFFYGSFVWSLWFSCVFFSEVRRSFKKMAVLWMIVNILNISNLSGMGMEIAAVFGGFTFKDLVQWQGMMKVNKIILSKAAERAGWTIGSECECSEK